MAYSDDLRTEVFNPSTAADLIDGFLGDKTLLSWVDYTPTITGSGVTVSTYTISKARYAFFNALCLFDIIVTGINFTDGGGAGEGFVFTLPVDSPGTNDFFMLTGRLVADAGTANTMSTWSAMTANNTIEIKYFDRRAFAASATNALFTVSGLFLRAQ